jgi:hypothetical protein
MQRLQNPNQSNADNLQNIRWEASRHFRKKKKKKENLKTKLDKLETNKEINNLRILYRGMNGFEKGYQLRANIVRDEMGNSVTDCYSILARWRNYFSQLFNVHGASDVRQRQINTAEPLVLSRVPLKLRWL